MKSPVVMARYCCFALAISSNDAHCLMRDSLFRVAFERGMVCSAALNVFSLATSGTRCS
jgi:hypothetical protein